MIFTKRIPARKKYGQIIPLFFKAACHFACLFLVNLKCSAIGVTDTTLINKKIQTLWQTRDVQPDTMLASLRELEILSRQKQYNMGIARTLLYQARMYDQSGKFEQCRNYCLNAVPFCDGSEAGQNILNYCYNQVANSYVEEGKYPQSTFYYYKALQNALAHHYLIPLANTYNNIGLLMNEVNEPQSALYYLKKSVAFASAGKMYDRLGNALTNEAVAYSNLKEYKKSMECYRQAVAIGEHLKDNNLYLSSLTGICNTFNNLKQPDSALFYGLKAQQAGLQADIYTLLFIPCAIGNAYALLHKNKEAIAHYEQFLKMSRDINLGRYTAEVQKSLGRLYYENGQAEKAAPYLERYVTYTDTLINSKIDHQITQMQIKYHTSEQEVALVESKLQIAIQQNQIREKNFQIVIICAVILFMILVFIIRQRYLSKRKAELRKQEKQLLEIAQLRAMIEGEEKERKRIAQELHDEVGGALSIAKLNYELLKNEQPQLAVDNHYMLIGSLIGKIITEIRTTSNNLMPDIVLRNTLEDAIKFMTEPLLLTRKIDIVVQAIGDLEALDSNFNLKLNIYRIVQELLNNVLKHADATEILIELMQTNNILKITVEDNGRGYSQEHVSKGLGLGNIMARVHNIRGRIYTESVLGQGTTVSVEVNLATMINNAA